MTQALLQGDGTLMLTDPEPYGFVELLDNIRHTVIEGDTLWTIAGTYYRSANIDRPSRFWWAIADFQPTGDNTESGPGTNHAPIFDPTLKLAVGRTIHVPSLRTLFEEILSERRRSEFL
jgi:hypothetical protein